MKKYSGFTAFGKVVSAERKQKTYEFVKEILPKTQKRTVISIINRACETIEHDRPFDLIGKTSSLDKYFKRIDLTGRYRLLATLLTDV